MSINILYRLKNPLYYHYITRRYVVQKTIKYEDYPIIVIIMSQLYQIMDDKLNAKIFLFIRNKMVKFVLDEKNDFLNEEGYKNMLNKIKKIQSTHLNKKYMLTTMIIKASRSDDTKYINPLFHYKGLKNVIDYLIDKDIIISNNLTDKINDYVNCKTLIIMKSNKVDIGYNYNIILLDGKTEYKYSIQKILGIHNILCIGECLEIKHINYTSSHLLC